MEPLNPGDKLILNFVKDTAEFIEVWRYEDAEGNEYDICCDQDGGEWIED